MTELEFEDYANQVQKSLERKENHESVRVLTSEQGDAALDDELFQLLGRIKSKWNVDAQREIYSAHGFLNPILNLVKRIVYAEVRASVEPFLAKQISLNADYVTLLDELTRRVTALQHLITALLEEHELMQKRIFQIKERSTGQVASNEVGNVAKFRSDKKPPLRPEKPGSSRRRYAD